MKVLKFGGTSVGTAASLTNVRAIVEGCRGEQVIVVVSALGGLTDCLIATARKAASGIDVSNDIRGFAKRHHEIIDALVIDRFKEEVKTHIDKLLNGLAGEYTSISSVSDADEAMDSIVAYGERMSSTIVTRIINGATRFDSLSFIKTATSHGRHLLDNDTTQTLIHSVFDNWRGDVAVVPGFISTETSDGRITNLGRGGSDYTAAILAASLGARVLEIWTDVDGFMTADPRVIDTARVVDNMTFVEAMDLCNFGAKVIYPPTIYPVFHRNIPIYIKNTFNPDAPGTRIAERTGSRDEEGGFKGISSMKDYSVIILDGKRLHTVDSLENRMLNAPGREGIDVIPAIPCHSGEKSIGIAVKSAAVDSAIDSLHNEFATEISNGLISDIHAVDKLATVAVVGEDLMRDDSIGTDIMTLLNSDGIKIIALSREASDTNFCFFTDMDMLQTALKLVHDTFLNRSISHVPRPEPPLCDIE